jgi:hypothetical protein
MERLGCKPHDTHVPVRGEIMPVDVERYESKRGVNGELRRIGHDGHECGAFVVSRVVV